ncbi:MAG: 2,3-bisphosphoglycerate-independent phosphoglycerate mutase [Gammaproteobacteria bacterium]|nr:2,3-bisphosphoglycerate-independent phosphoglycerate mutase [Gammaproteobacteria bacterium]
MTEAKFELQPRAGAAAGRPVVLVIMDGIGVGRGDQYDAVALAFTPTLDALTRSALTRTLRAHGTAVGLPSDKDMGNSEVGHNILGAGRIFDQGAKCVDRAIAEKSIFGATWRALMAQAAGGALHLLGLLSDGNVHASMAHLRALLEEAAGEGLRRVFVHTLLDGRDVPDRSAHEYVAQLEQLLARLSAETGGDYAIASGGGRMSTTMDRYEADWSIVERGWRAHVLGEGRRFSSAEKAIAAFRDEQPGVSDQRLPAFVIAREGRPIGCIADGDAVLIYNFRGDRAVQICRAFTEDEGFNAFDRIRCPEVYFAGMVQYDGDLALPQHYLVSPETVGGTVSEYLANTGIAQFACSETQKFGHVTYFWNGNRSGKFSEQLETYVEIPSDTAPFEQRPWMKSAETADAVIAAIGSGKFPFIRTNFAGGDMVGHTGELQAARLAVEAVDLALGRIKAAADAAGGWLVVTADHGNADDMVERDGEGRARMTSSGVPYWRTSHSLNPVPFFASGAKSDGTRLRQGLNQAGLANVAATIIDLLGYAPPPDYEPGLLERAS